MKKYNTLFVVVVSILAVLLLTWVLPITYLNGTLMEEPTSQAGIANLFMYPTYTFYIFVYTFVYLLAVGGLYGLLNRTGAYRSLLDKIVNYTKKHEIVWLVVTVLLISIVVSFTGFTIQALIVLPLIASLVLLLGYDNSGNVIFLDSCGKYRNAKKRNLEQLILGCMSGDSIAHNWMRMVIFSF